MESIHKCLDTTQKVILALELYASGLSEETKVLREQGAIDQGMTLDMLRRMQEMEIRMNLLQAQTAVLISLLIVSWIDPFYLDYNFSWFCSIATGGRISV